MLYLQEIFTLSAGNFYSLGRKKYFSRQRDILSLSEYAEYLLQAYLVESVSKPK